MTNGEALDKLLESYTNTFDVERPYTFQGDTFDAYACCDITSARYVLVKRAELWRTLCYEHAFFMNKEKICTEDIEKFQNQIKEYIEPQLVRKGEKQPPKDHMYTYVTGVFLSETPVDAKVQNMVKKFRYYKNYLWAIRGYCEGRIVVLDMPQGKIYTNPAGKDLQRGYREILKPLI